MLFGRYLKAPSVQRWVLPGLPCPQRLDLLTGLPQWEPPSREKEPCAGQGQCLRLLPDPLAPACGSEHGACLMQQRMPLLLLLFLIQSSCSELVFKETQVFKKMQPLLSLGLCCSTERIGRRIWDEDPRPFPIGARSQP